MSTDDFKYLDDTILKPIVEFVARALAQPPPDPTSDKDRSQVVRTLIFLIDESTKYLDRLRQSLADEGGGEVEDAPDDSSIGGKGLVETIKLILAQALKQPDALARNYANFASEALRILRDESDLAPQPSDFRFKDPLWLSTKLLRPVLQLYLAWGQTMQHWLEEQELDQSDRKRIDLILRQLIAAIAPSNLPLNPAALRRAESTEGSSVVSGLKHWIDDVIHNRAMPRQVRADAFVVGKDVAVTEGAVVYRNDQLELIQYSKQSESVRRRPVLFIPAQINKFYFADLRPRNSVVGYFSKGGLQLFMISWRNPTVKHSDWNLDTYVRATIEATDVVREITKSRTLGLVSACAGGFTAMAMLGYLAEIGDRRIAHHTLLVTCLFPNKGSEIELFVTQDSLELARSYVRINGVMDGGDLGKAFYWLRPNDLVWRYWINNYLLGKTPPPLDVLFWDNDSTRLPAALHSDFLDMYAKDVFQRPYELEVLGRKIDFRKVRVNSYFVGGEDDTLMPWEGCYQACRVFRGRHEFVLSPSGHLQSLLRPPNVANTYHYANRDTTLGAAEWLRTATKCDGSWWRDWERWFHENSGSMKAAPPRLGSTAHPPIIPAPGSYVFD
jgi:poly[(R)-3-hydroxyalkanoate] polymerase subunit PhaC